MEYNQSEADVHPKRQKKSIDGPINIDFDNKDKMSGWDAAFSKLSNDNRGKISQFNATPSVSDLSPRPSDNRQSASNFNLSKLSAFTNNQLVKSQQKKIDSQQKKLMVLEANLKQSAQKAKKEFADEKACFQQKLAQMRTQMLNMKTKNEKYERKITDMNKKFSNHEIGLRVEYEKDINQFKKEFL